MKNVNIFIESGEQKAVNGIFYIFNSKYYFIYTQGEVVDSDYVQLYVVQVCKEIQRTQNGTIDTGYMLGLDISDSEEWALVQDSITKIVFDKKNNTDNAEIQYLPIEMLVNLKIISKNKFKLMKKIVEENFEVVLAGADINIENSDNESPELADDLFNKNNQQEDRISEQVIESALSSDNNTFLDNENDVIIDYRAKFFEEQDKVNELQAQLEQLQEKLNSIKSLLE